MRELSYIELAGIKIAFQCNYDYCYKICENYKIDEQEVDFCIKVTPEEVACEKQNFPNFDIGYLESLCLFRKIAENLPKYNSVVFHGAAITYNNEGIVFTAPSGVGKSTHIALWKKHFGDEVDIINGDKPILSIREGKVMVSGCPWGGKEKWQKNRTAKLKAICFLRRGKVNSIRRINASEILYDLLKQVYLPNNQNSAECTLEMIDYVFSNVPIYVLECDISELAVLTSFEGITNKL